MIDFKHLMDGYQEHEVQLERHIMRNGKDYSIAAMILYDTLDTFKEFPELIASYHDDERDELMKEARECDAVTYEDEEERRNKLVQQARFHNHCAIALRRVSKAIA